MNIRPYKQRGSSETCIDIKWCANNHLDAAFSHMFINALKNHFDGNEIFEDGPNNIVVSIPADTIDDAWDAVRGAKEVAREALRKERACAIV